MAYSCFQLTYIACTVYICGAEMTPKKHTHTQDEHVCRLISFQTIFTHNARTSGIEQKKKTKNLNRRVNSSNRRTTRNRINICRREKECSHTS